MSTKTAAQSTAHFIMVFLLVSLNLRMAFSAADPLLTQVRHALHMGITSTNYMHIIDNVITSTEVFYDTEQTGEKAEYHYNGESVAKIYYNWKLNSFRKEYEKDMVCVNGGSDGWSISEENIKEVLKR